MACAQIIKIAKISNNLVKKWAEDMKRHFSKDDIQMVKKHTKICPTSLSIRKIRIKTTLKYHLIPVKMAIITKTKNNKC